MLTLCCNTYCWDRLENHRYLNFQPVHLVMAPTDVSGHFISWDLCSTLIWFECSFYLRCGGPWGRHMAHTWPQRQDQKLQSGCRSTVSAGSVQEHQGTWGTALLHCCFPLGSCFGVLSMAVLQITPAVKSMSSFLVFCPFQGVECELWAQGQLCFSWAFTLSRGGRGNVHQWMPLLAFGVTSLCLSVF